LSARVLLLGGSGFLGRHLAARLAAAGVAVESPRSQELDLRAEGAALQLEKRIGADTVVVHAARARGGVHADDRTISSSLARAVARVRARHLIHLSSTAVYGDASDRLALDEASSVSPSNAYGAGKLEAEALLTAAAAQSGTPLSTLRVSLVYGPGDGSPPYGPGRFLQSLLRDGRVNIFGDGTERRPYLFAPDLAEIVFRLLDAPGGLVNVGPESRSVQDALAALRNAHGRDFPVTTLERDRPKTDQTLSGDRLAARIPGFAFTKLEDGVRATYRELSKSLGRAAA
jgi:nucleoside-diphosphate-sugar epimerase